MVSEIAKWFPVLSCKNVLRQYFPLEFNIACHFPETTKRNRKQDLSELVQC